MSKHGIDGDHDGLDGDNDTAAAEATASSSSSSSSVVNNKNKSSKSQDPLIGMVEIAWRGSSRRVAFPLPIEHHYLTPSTRTEFLNRVLLETVEKRLLLMFREMDIFVHEMKWVRLVSERSKFYRQLKKQFQSIQSLVYALVVLLNLNVLMSSPSVAHPISAAFFNNNDGDGKNKEEEEEPLEQSAKLSLAITFVLGTLSLVGYFVIMAYHAVTTVPVLVIRTDSESKRRVDSGVKTFTNIRAFKWWFVTLAFNLIFILIHWSNLPQYRAQSNSLYAFVVAVNLPWTFSCMRHYIVVPRSPAARLFVITYDAVITLPHFRNHIILLFLLLMGFQSTEFFTLILFDILNLK